jgi:hypothetical protein
MWRVSRIIGVVGAVVFLFTAGAGPAAAESAVAQTAVQQSPSVQDWDG